MSTAAGMPAGERRETRVSTCQVRPRCRVRSTSRNGGRALGWSEPAAPARPVADAGELEGVVRLAVLMDAGDRPAARRHLHAVRLQGQRDLHDVPRAAAGRRKRSRAGPGPPAPRAGRRPCAPRRAGWPSTCTSVGTHCSRAARDGHRHRRRGSHLEAQAASRPARPRGTAAGSTRSTGSSRAWRGQRVRRSSSRTSGGASGRRGRSLLRPALAGTPRRRAARRSAAAAGGFRQGRRRPGRFRRQQHQQDQQRRADEREDEAGRGREKEEAHPLRAFDRTAPAQIDLRPLPLRQAGAGVTTARGSTSWSAGLDRASGGGGGGGGGGMADGERLRDSRRRDLIDRRLFLRRPAHRFRRNPAIGSWSVILAARAIRRARPGASGPAPRPPLPTETPGFSRAG